MQIQLKNGKPTWMQGWYMVGEKRIYFRSKWEWKYACYLEVLLRDKQITDWKYEPKTFYFEGIKRGTNNYKPDFLVTHLNGNEEYIEVKGYETSKDATKWKRMGKYFPDVKLRIIKSDWFKSNNKALDVLVKQFQSSKLQQ